MPARRCTGLRRGAGHDARTQEHDGRRTRAERGARCAGMSTQDSERTGRARGDAWLVGHYDVALAVAGAKYPGLSDDDHVDIVQAAMTNVWRGCAAARSPTSGPITTSR